MPQRQNEPTPTSQPSDEREDDLEMADGDEAFEDEDDAADDEPGADEDEALGE